MNAASSRPRRASGGQTGELALARGELTERQKRNALLPAVRAVPCIWVGQGQILGAQILGAQELRQPARALEQALGFARHVALLGVLDELRRFKAQDLLDRLHGRSPFGLPKEQSYFSNT
jgi:hypothetical protein